MKGFLDNFMAHVPPVTPTETQLKAIRSLYESQKKEREAEERERKKQQEKEKEEEFKSETLPLEDFNSWLKRDIWSLSEAVALIFGKDPYRMPLHLFTSAMSEVKEIALTSIEARKLRAIYVGGVFYKVYSSEFLMWAYNKDLIVSNEFKDVAKQLKAENISKSEPSKQKEHSPKVSQIDKAVVQAIARCLWDQAKDESRLLPASDIIKHPWILKFGNGSLYKGTHTLKDWLREVDPRPLKEKRGRPKKKSEKK